MATAFQLDASALTGIVAFGPERVRVRAGEKLDDLLPELSANGLGPVSYAASGFAAEHTLSGLFLGGGAIVGLAWIFSRSPAFNNATT